MREVIRMLAVEDPGFIDKINPSRANLTFDEIIEKVWSRVYKVFNIRLTCWLINRSNLFLCVCLLISLRALLVLDDFLVYCMIVFVIIKKYVCNLNSSF